VHQVGFPLSECEKILDTCFKLFVHFHDICDSNYEGTILKINTFIEFMCDNFSFSFIYAAVNGNNHDIVRNWQRCCKF
jgi:hypothetical protein